MSEIERITVTVTSELAADMKAAIAEGDYASSSEVVREALRDWRMKRLVQRQAFEELRAAIAEGIADADAGRVKDFDPEEIIRRGRQRLAKSSGSG